MCYIRDNDPEFLDLYFSIEEDQLGEVSTAETDLFSFILHFIHTTLF